MVHGAQARKQQEGRLRKIARNGQWRLTIDEKKRILITHIFGVDIDAQAVEVTKLSLLLKVLEGETDQSVSRQQRLVPRPGAAEPGRQHQVRQFPHRPGLLHRQADRGSPEK